MAEEMLIIPTENDDRQMKETRAQLREDFMRTMAAMSKHSAKIQMHQNTKVAATFENYHPDGKKVIVSDAHLPNGEVQKTAMLRTGDIETFVFRKKSS